MKKIDLRPVKTELRKKYKDIRGDMSSGEKQRRDYEIFRRFTAMKKYKDAKIVLAYVSMPDETDTRRIIQHAFEKGKKVAVPYCTTYGKTKEPSMEFYFTNSLDELVPGCFGVPEPEPRNENRFSEEGHNPDVILIAPGLAFDYQGFRLGYGKGYYDRFLNRYKGFRVGLCYNCCMTEQLPCGYFDKPVDVIVTEKFTKIV